MDANDQALTPEESAALLESPGGPQPPITPEMSQRYPNLDKVLSLEMPVVVVLADKATTLEEVLSLNQGSVIVFKKHNSEPLDILVHDRKIGAGKTIKVGERFALHVRKIGTPQEILAGLR